MSHLHSYTHSHPEAAQFKHSLTCGHGAATLEQLGLIKGLAQGHQSGADVGRDNHCLSNIWPEHELRCDDLLNNV